MSGKKAAAAAAAASSAKAPGESVDLAKAQKQLVNSMNYQKKNNEEVLKLPFGA